MHHEVVPSLGHVVKDLFELAEPHECLLTSLGVRCQKVTTQLLDHLGILSLTTISEIVVGIVWIPKFYLSELPYMVWDVQSVDPLFDDLEHLESDQVYFPLPKFKPFQVAPAQNM